MTPLYFHQPEDFPGNRLRFLHEDPLEPRFKGGRPPRLQHSHTQADVCADLLPPEPRFKAQAPRPWRADDDRQPELERLKTVYAADGVQHPSATLAPKKDRLLFLFAFMFGSTAGSPSSSLRQQQ